MMSADQPTTLEEPLVPLCAAARGQARPETLDKFPLFHSGAADESDVDSLGRAFLPLTPLGRVPIPQRAVNVCNRIGIMTLRQLLLTPAGRLLDEPGFGVGTLRSVQSNVSRFLLEPAEPSAQIDYASFDSMVRSFLHIALNPRVTNQAFVQNPRNRQIVLERVGLGLPRIPTLRELGTRHGISKERVRQIVSASRSIMGSPEVLQFLKRFWQAVASQDGNFRSHGGIETLADFLRSHFSWQEAPSCQVLVSLCELHPKSEGERP